MLKWFKQQSTFMFVGYHSPIGDHCNVSEKALAAGHTKQSNKISGRNLFFENPFVRQSAKVGFNRALPTMSFSNNVGYRLVLHHYT